MSSLPEFAPGCYVAGLGESLFDLFPSGAKLGGAPLNMAVHCRQLLSGLGAGRLPVKMISRIGQDSLGDEILHALAGYRVDTSLIQRDPQLASGTVEVTLEQGQPSYRISEPSAWDAIEWTPQLASEAGSCVAVCFGTLAQRDRRSAASMAKFLRSAPSAIRLLDINRRPPFDHPAVLRQSLGLCNQLKCNHQELAWLAQLLGIEPPQAWPESLRASERPAASESAFTDSIRWTNSDWCELAERVRVETNTQRLLLTRGSQGCLLLTEQGGFEGEVPRLEIAPDADAVGAGDATAATLLVTQLLGWPASGTVRAANLVGAFVASRSGATPKLPESLLETLRPWGPAV
jgi:fructokinase